MKRVIIMTEKMNMGGVENALISMLQVMNYDNYDVTLLLTVIEGELIYKIPKQVKVITLDEFKQIDHRVLKRSINGIYHILKCKFRGDLHGLYKYYCKLIPKIEEEYDLAISYQAPSRLPSVYVANNIEAKKKVLWLHNDPSKSPCNISYYEESYSRYDKVFCVANSIKEKFIEIFPKLKDKAEVFYNIVPVDEILAKSKENEVFNDKYKGIRLLTIGRLSPEKGYNMAINVCEKMIKDGYEIRWYVCGEGGQRNELEALIKEKGIEENFLLLGNITNPYPYLNKCDIYVQPSLFEGYCTTTNEARVLCKPVITTDVSGAREQFNNYENGIIVPIEEEKIYRAVKTLLDDKNMRGKFIRALSRIDLKKSNHMYKLDKISN